MKKQSFVMVFLGLIVASGAAMAQMEEESASSGAGTEGSTPTWYSCYSCSSCTTQLANHTHVKLTGMINDYTTGPGGSCILIPGKDNRVFDCQWNSINSMWTPTGRSGIKISSSDFVEIKNCDLTGWGRDQVWPFEDAAIHLYNSNYCSIHDNYISGGCCGRNGIILQLSDHNTLTRNVVEYTKKIGIGTHDYSHYNTLEHNEVYYSKTGISTCFNSDNTTLTYNTTIDNTDEGFCFCNGSAYNVLSYSQTWNNGYKADIKQYDKATGGAAGPGNHGDLNRCYDDNVYNWNDDETTGCTYTP